MRALSKRAPALIATIAVAALAAGGCGGGSDKRISIADAKAKLSKDCQERNASDKRLCDCIADELAKGGRSGKQIDAIRQQVNGGDTSKLPTAAAHACGVQFREEGAEG